MVLETLIPSKWLEKHFHFSFFLGAGFTIIGFILARLLFGANSGLASVMFISLLLLPALRRLFRREEVVEEGESKFSFKKLFLDNLPLMRIYLGVFHGVFITFFLITFLGAFFGMDVTMMLKEQLFLDPAVSGRAIFQSGVFVDILVNNFWVLLACFMLGLLSGDGALFFVVWNASAWASIFAYRAIVGSFVLSWNPLFTAFILLIIVYWHTLVEGFAYILAGISGSLISFDVVREYDDLPKFLGLLILGLIMFVFLWFLVSSFFFNAFVKLIIFIIYVVGVLHLIGLTCFKQKKHRQVYLYNLWLFIGAILVFFIGAFLETMILSNSGTLSIIYNAVV